MGRLLVMSNQVAHRRDLQAGGRDVAPQSASRQQRVSPGTARGRAVEGATR